MTFIINPGTGPVAKYGSDVSFDNALANMIAFMADDGQGRFGFTLNGPGWSNEIQMPGLPLERVRWMEDDGTDIWDFPRLYVDHSSWIWQFALNVCGPRDESSESVGEDGSDHNDH